MNNKNFLTVDFETASTRRNSACQVAVTIVNDGKIIETIDSLIKPPGNEYNRFNISIHKITPEKTRNSPTFDEWHNDIFIPKLKDINFSYMIAHNVGFDRSVYNNSLTSGHFDFNWFCTHQAFKKLGYEKTKLNILCDKFDIPLEHHNAKSDANATAHLYLEYLKIIEI